MSDYYRDRVRHAGILLNTFISKVFCSIVSTTPFLIASRVVVGSPGSFKSVRSSRPSSPKLGPGYTGRQSPGGGTEGEQTGSEPGYREV